jgi:hypothetical protein
MFWNRKQREEKEVNLPGPKAIPDWAGRYMVVQKKVNPDWVWKLRGVTRPAPQGKTLYCRVFDETQVTQAGLKVKDWTSLDGHPELILWEGHFDKGTNTTREDKFVKRSNSPN